MAMSVQLYVLQQADSTHQNRRLPRHPPNNRSLVIRPESTVQANRPAAEVPAAEVRQLDGLLVPHEAAACSQAPVYDP